MDNPETNTVQEEVDTDIATSASAATEVGEQEVAEVETDDVAETETATAAENTVESQDSEASDGAVLASVQGNLNDEDGEDTLPDPDEADEHDDEGNQNYTRKRPIGLSMHDGDHDDGGVRKRINLSGEPTAGAASTSHSGIVSAAQLGANNICVLKFLVNNNDAGNVIGKRGANVNDLQARTGCEIKLSQHGVVFPGSTSRVILLRGSRTQVMAALAAITAQRADTFSQGNPTIDLAQAGFVTVIVVPLAMAGPLIGHKGENINQLQSASNARIQLASKESIVPGVSERQISIVGTVDDQVKAISLILDQMRDAEGDAGVYSNPSTQYSSMYRPSHNPFARDFHASAAPPFGMRRPGPASPMVQPGSSVLEITVPDKYIGGVVGRKGAVIMHIQESSGARVQVSQKGVYMPGTNRRIITITGSQAQCDAARSMITENVEEQTRNDQSGVAPAAAFGTHGDPRRQSSYASSGQYQPRSSYGGSNYGHPTGTGYGSGGYGSSGYGSSSGGSNYAGSRSSYGGAYRGADYSQGHYGGSGSSSTGFSGNYRGGYNPQVAAGGSYGQGSAVRQVQQHYGGPIQKAPVHQQTQRYGGNQARNASFYGAPSTQAAATSHQATSHQSYSSNPGYNRSATGPYGGSAGHASQSYMDQR